jgi:methionyl aminopeptidase
MVIAVEPMVNQGTRRIKVMPDGWTAVTEDGKLSAHFEHTVIVGKKEAEILT